ncbi:protein of unknown function [Acidithiobacillus ferrivorans]|uniref:Uncharacterized protein n=1 Tax=Acidithiobacillus ferrivorans TaxID=160808 RepID=A0A060UP71_9PROT|nr:hypothetical protein AFERRI_100033 [Acidithiobacillus ferrivorans]SMH66801.1 protein of unknown function [Acidithiobacillus ferrivorans]
MQDMLFGAALALLADGAVIEQNRRHRHLSPTESSTRARPCPSLAASYRD